jgi:hypothetical protein
MLLQTIRSSTLYSTLLGLDWTIPDPKRAQIQVVSFQGTAVNDLSTGISQRQAMYLCYFAVSFSRSAQ